jgi:uncharacterized UBP type Zn finger protein
VNSTIQALFHIVAFKLFVLTLKSNPKHKVVSAVRLLFARMVCSAECGLSTIDLTTALGYANNTEDHDPHEFLFALTVAMCEESEQFSEFFAGTFKGLKNGAFDWMHILHYLSTFTILVLSFCSFYCAEGVKCPTCCNETQHNNEQYMGIFLTLDGTDCFADLLRALTAKSTLDLNNQWICSACKKEVPAIQHLTFECTPPVLITSLKRVSFDKVGPSSLCLCKSIYTCLYNITLHSVFVNSHSFSLSFSLSLSLSFFLSFSICCDNKRKLRLSRSFQELCISIQRFLPKL